MRKLNMPPIMLMRRGLLVAGFIVADEKSVWQPTQVIEWLRLTWDAKDGTLAISDKRISKATKLLCTAAECPILCRPVN